MSNFFLTLFFILLLGAAGLYLVGKADAPNQPREPRTFDVCTTDAKECPDGSFVGRDSRNRCEFYPCPDEVAEDDGDDAPTVCAQEVRLCPDGETEVGRDSDRHCAFAACPGEGTVSGTVTLAPTCPYESTFDKPCPTESYEGDLSISPVSGGIVRAAVVYGGKFFATLPADTYEISTGKVLPRCDATFTVVAGKDTKFAATCESGIR